ncbi:MAG: FAD-binding protein, partial [Candidatus Heimdallarchaeaceae archaeon]
MTLKKTTRTRFTRYLSKNFRDDYTTLQIYSRDMSDLPKVVKLFVGNLPDGVIQVRNTEDMQKIYEIANETRVPITQRGGGTAGFGGCVPYKKGVVVDTKGLESHFLVDPLELT